MLEVELIAGIRAVGLEADGEQDEGHVGEGDGEPGDELVLQGCNPTTQQRLQRNELAKMLQILAILKHRKNAIKGQKSPPPYDLQCSNYNTFVHKLMQTEKNWRLCAMVQRS